MQQFEQSTVVGIYRKLVHQTIIKGLKNYINFVAYDLLNIDVEQNIEIEVIESVKNYQIARME